MKPILLDVIKFTSGLEFDSFKLIVDNATGKAIIKSSTSGKDVMLDAEIKAPMMEFAIESDTQFNSIGFVHIDVLAGYLRSSFFDNQEKDPITVKHSPQGLVSELEFTSTMGHICTYRVLDPQLAKRRIPTMRRIDADGDSPTIAFSPSEDFVRDLTNMSSVLSSASTTFNFRVNNGTLMADLGNVDNKASIPVTKHSGESISPEYKYQTKRLLNIVKKASSLDDVMISIFNNTGIMEVVVNSEFATYKYIMNAGG